MQVRTPDAVLAVVVKGAAVEVVVAAAVTVGSKRPWNLLAST